MICDLRCLTCPYSECIREQRQKDTYKKYYEANKEKRRAYQRNYNRCHPEQHRESMKKYQEAHKEQKREYDRQRYLRKKNERKQAHDARPISVSSITAEYKGCNDKEKNTGLDK